jgi:hypothetical protein
MFELTYAQNIRICNPHAHKTFACLDQRTQDFRIVSLARFQSASSLITINHLNSQFRGQSVCRQLYACGMYLDLERQTSCKQLKKNNTGQQNLTFFLSHELQIVNLAVLLLLTSDMYTECFYQSGFQRYRGIEMCKIVHYVLMKQAETFL